jgi:MFS family permease
VFSPILFRSHLFPNLACDYSFIQAALDKIEMKEVYDLNNTEGGILGGAYMIGYVVASPTFAYLSKHYRPMRMMGGGLLVWCIATAFSGLSVDYYSLLVARAFTGVGEASFLVLAPPFIDKFAPPEKRSVGHSIPLS